MTTFNIETTLPTGKLHKRQSGLWGQLLASSEIEAKLARVEPLYKELHGRNLNRTAFFGMCRDMTVSVISVIMFMSKTVDVFNNIIPTIAQISM